MGGTNHDTPPSEWVDWWATPVTMLTTEIGYGWPGPDLTASPDDPNPWFYHWCEPYGRWDGQACTDHTLVSREPLRMEPSLLWRCCNTHGFVREGRWVPA